MNALIGRQWSRCSVRSVKNAMSNHPLQGAALSEATVVLTPMTLDEVSVVPVTVRV